MKRVVVASLALLFGLTAMLAHGTAHADEPRFGERSVMSERAIEERLRAPGRVCLEGDEECGPEMVAAADEEEEDAARDPGDIYQDACAACHDTGTAGAPVIGELGDWEARFDKGTDELVQSTVDGMGAMPPMGGCRDCDEDDIRAVVEYIMEQTQ